ncbi:hypothetical protein ACFLIM_15660 [Nonomuraea sp. M3C6]|uniref:Uncharacterized protein n=1 Tax=Nonomuraea marmarensis TaxID=3351344 RepID=A0ABW7AE99_9ACTN
MYKQGLILAGVVGGMVMLGGPALAATPSITATQANSAILPGPGSDREDPEFDFGEWNNFGEDNDIVDVDILNQLLKSVLSGG